MSLWLGGGACRLAVNIHRGNVGQRETLAARLSIAPALAGRATI